MYSIWSSGLAYAQFIQWTLTWFYSTVGSLPLPPNSATSHRSLGDVEGFFSRKGQGEGGLGLFLDLYHQVYHQILQQAYNFPCLPFTADAPVAAFFVTPHIFFQLLLQLSFGFPCSTPLLKYLLSSAWRDGIAAQCNLLTNPLSVECFLKHYLRNSCSSSISFVSCKHMQVPVQVFI